MTFPERPLPDVQAYADAYFEQVERAGRSVDRDVLALAASTLAKAYDSGQSVYACGNGGSAAIANHLACDHLKGAQTDTALRPRVTSLSSNLELITAIANDLSFDDIFSYQLRTLGVEGDVLVSISSSGDSENVVRAVQWAKANGLATIALTGFSGGRSGETADVHLHVEADNYGVIEDVHQSIMHVLAQFLRLEAMPEALVGERRF